MNAVTMLVLLAAMVICSDAKKPPLPPPPPPPQPTEVCCLEFMQEFAVYFWRFVDLCNVPSSDTFDDDLAAFDSFLDAHYPFEMNIEGLYLPADPWIISEFDEFADFTSQYFWQNISIHIVSMYASTANYAIYYNESVEGGEYEIAGNILGFGAKGESLPLVWNEWHHWDTLTFAVETDDEGNEKCSLQKQYTTYESMEDYGVSAADIAPLNVHIPQFENYNNVRSDHSGVIYEWILAHIWVTLTIAAICLCSANAWFVYAIFRCIQCLETKHYVKAKKIQDDDTDTDFTLCE